MTSPRSCSCPEETADETDFSWDTPNGKETNAHTHVGCLVFHKGMTCTIQPEEPMLPGMEP